MPLVRAYIGYNLDDEGEVDGLELEHMQDWLFIACREIIPAGMTSEEGRLTPGSIEYFAHDAPRAHMTVDVFIEIEAFPYEDRGNLDERAENIKAALKELFPAKTFAVWPKLVRAGYASDSSDPDFDGDMSMAAAVERARQALAA